ncbi:MAG: 30S ribosomal protein S9 [Patescibacteria group bacterium]|mgnify:CR=1 FL=1
MSLTPRVRRTYLYAVGRRKCATARVRIYKKGDPLFLVNEQDVTVFFSEESLQSLVFSPLEKASLKDQLRITVKVAGGGKRGQAESVRHGLSRALLKWDKELRPALKKAGFLRRDPRVKERKKYGLKRARRAPQWAKR